MTIEETIRTALRKNPHTPEIGFDDRSDRQLLSLTSQSVRRKWPAVRWIAATLCMTLALATALAASVEEVNAMLYQWWPEGAKALMPVNAVCENQGIRMEVLSAVAEKEKLLMIFSAQDLEADRLSGNTQVEMEIPSMPGSYGASKDSAEPVYDAENRKVTSSEYSVYSKDLSYTGENLMLRVPWLQDVEATETDLLPLLDRYREKAAYVAAPENARILWQIGDVSWKVPADLQVLDPAGSLEIPLCDGAALSGIGIRDGLLHVQLHYLDNHWIEIRQDNHKMSYVPVSGFVSLTFPEDGTLEDYANQGLNGIGSLGWDEDQDGNCDWEEYLFTLPPEGLERASLQAKMEVQKTPLMGPWEVTVPFRMIQYR